MNLRIINLIVIGSLILAAAYVYRIKFDATVQAERLAKIRSEVRRARDAVAALRAEWSELDNPARIEALAKRHLPLKPVNATQFSSLDQLPERSPQLVSPDSRDPIGDIIETLEEPRSATGSVRAPAAASGVSDQTAAPAPGGER